MQSATERLAWFVWSFPIPDDDLERKFVDCASTVVDQPQAHEAARVVMALENQSNLRPLLHLLVAAPDEEQCCCCWT